MAATLFGDDSESIAEAASSIGYPVVLKASGLLHKSDRGGVRLNLQSDADVRIAASEMLQSLGPEALPLSVQSQYEGMELIIGMRREAGIGAAVVAGIGGIHAEVLADVVMMLAPVTAEAAAEELKALRGYPLLIGHRGSEPVDLDAIIAAVVAVSDLAESCHDLAELDLNPLMVGPAGKGATCVDIRASFDDTLREPVRSTARARALDPLFNPKSVAVVGVSDDRSKTGTRIFENLRRHGFSGAIHPVHPAGGNIDGFTRYENLGQIPGPVDLVSIAVPAASVPDVVRDAVSAGAASVIVHSSQFAEAGEEGRRAQAVLADLAVRNDIAIAGPNSMGIVVPSTGLSASLSDALSLKSIRAGSVALISSSGALGSSIASRLLDLPGLSRWVHLGNEASLTAADFLHWLATDPETKAVGVILENIVNGAELVSAGRALVASGKPVLAYNIGRTEAGRRATTSHTGALVGSYEIRELLLKEAGIVSVPTLQTFEDALVLAGTLGLPRGTRLGAITASGGACAVIADEASSAGLVLPDLPDAVQTVIAKALPSYAAVRNPLDVTAEVIRDADGLIRALETFETSGLFDALLLQMTTNADPRAAEIAQHVVELISVSSIPLYIARFGSPDLAPKGMTVYAENGIPVMDAPDRAVRAIGQLAKAYQTLPHSA